MGAIAIPNGQKKLRRVSSKITNKPICRWRVYCLNKITLLHLFQIKKSHTSYGSFYLNLP
jgi:hypothetical protein